MLCPGGHEILATVKNEGYLPFQTKHTCYLCDTDIGSGGRYHGCNMHCAYMCGACYEKGKASHRYRPACKEAFPAGLGPFDMAQTSLAPGDLKVGSSPSCRSFKGGAASLEKTFFSHSKGLLQLWQALISHGVIGRRRGAPPHGTLAEHLVVHLSPLSPIVLSPFEQRTLDLREGTKVFYAWLNPPFLDWPSLLDDLDELEELRDSDESMLTLGAFVYFRAQHDSSDLEVISAKSLLFRPQGSLTFSEPQPWQSRWTPHFASRFQTVCAHKWHKVGAQKICWIGFGEALPASKGDRCLAHRGGFVILCGGLEANGSFYETVTDPLSTILNVPMPRKLGHSSLQGSLRHKSLRRTISGGLPFSIERPNPDHVSKLRLRFFTLAQNGHWGLVSHLLAEYPTLAELKDEDTGESVLHKCALARCNDQSLLGRLHRLGVKEDLKDNRGLTASDLGDRIFCTLVHQIWGLAPDLFKCPEAWFDHWDLDKSGVLEPAELAEALAAAYDVGEPGRAWIQTYVNTYYDELARGGVITKAAFVDDGGLLDLLQSSDEFIHLRAKDRPQMPALFHKRRRQPSQSDVGSLAAVESDLDEMRRDAGWFVEIGRSAPDPKLVKELELPPPFSAGDADPVARLTAAREMLAWTFVKTSLLSGEDWIRGFRIAFRGEDGVDDFGLTKAWIQELAFALWGDDLLFEEKSTGFLFKPDDVTHVQLHCFHIKTSELYYWCGCFLAYAIYARCVLDCRLCPWVLRWLQRIQDADYVRFCESRSIDGEWSRTEDGESTAFEIEDSVLRSYDDDSCVLEMPLHIDGVSLEFEVDGSSFSGVVDNGRILWDDGDVWEKRMDDLAPSRAKPSWPESQSGEEQMLEDVACLDPDLANSYWRLLHELSDDDWKSMVLDDEDIELTAEMKLQYVQERCLETLWSQTRVGLSMFVDGFMEVIPPGFTASCPDDIFLWLLGGSATTVEQMVALERLVFRSGLVPCALADHKLVQQCARWVFAVAKEGDGKFRSRFLEFWMGITCMPMSGPSSIRPEPKLQVMVQRDGGKGGIKPIGAWPSTRLPEGHTCGNELWIPLCKTKEELSRSLKMAVGNFEAGFAIS